MLGGIHSMIGRWAIAFTHPNLEAKAVIDATRQGFKTYLPKISVRKKIRYKNRAARIAHVLEPLFPRYLFVLVEGPWRSLSNTQGVAHVLMSGDKPATLGQQVIDKIRAQCDNNGLFTQFTQGQKVQVDNGPFAGCVGIYRGMAGAQRSSVLLSMLGGDVKTSVLESDLSAA